MSYVGRLAQRTLDFVVVAVTDQHQRVALLGELDGLKMDLGDKRAGGVNDPEIAASAALTNRGRHAMGAVDDALAVGHVVDLVDKNCALFRQLVHNIAVMDDLAADVDGRAEGLQSDLDDVDGADDSGAKTTWFEQQHPLFATGSVARTMIGTVMGNGFDSSYSHISKYTNGRGKGTGEKSDQNSLPQQQLGRPLSHSVNSA